MGREKKDDMGTGLTPEQTKTIESAKANTGMATPQQVDMPTSTPTTMIKPMTPEQLKNRKNPFKENINLHGTRK